MKTFVAWTLAGAVTLSGRADALSVAYVAQPYAGTFSALSTLRGEVTANIPLALPFQSQFVRLSPDGARAYLASGLDVSVVDMQNSRILFTFELPNCTWGLCSIHGFELSADGNLLYLATDDLVTYHGRLYVLEALSGTVLESYELNARPQTMVRGSTGLLYLADESSDTLVVFDPAEKREISAVHLRSLASGVVVSPDATLLFVTTNEKGTNAGRRVDVFDGLTFDLVASLPVPDYFGAVAVAPDGRTLYVAGSTALIVFDTTRFSVVATIAGEGLGDLIVWPDGTSVYLLKRWSDQVLDIDTRDYSIHRTFEVPIGGTDVFSRDGTQAYFPAFFDPRGLSVFDRATDTVSTILQGSGPNQVAVRDDGRFAYGIGDQLVWVIDTATHAEIGSFSLSAAPPEEDSLPPPNRRKYLPGNPIMMLDLERNRVARRMPLPDGIQVGAVTPSADGQRLYAGTTGSLIAGEDVCSLGHVVVLDTATGVILDQIALPQTGLPVAVALEPQEKDIYVAIRAPERPDVCGRFEPEVPECGCPDFSGVVVLSLASHRGVAAIAVGTPSDVVVHPNGQTAYVAAYHLLLVDTRQKEVVGVLRDIFKRLKRTAGKTRPLSGIAFGSEEKFLTCSKAG